MRREAHGLAFGRNGSGASEQSVKKEWRRLRQLFTAQFLLGHAGYERFRAMKCLERLLNGIGLRLQPLWVDRPKLWFRKNHETRIARCRRNLALEQDRKSVV